MKQINNYILEKLYIGKGYQSKPNVNEIIDFLNPPEGCEDKLREKLEKWIENNNISSYGYYVKVDDAKNLSKDQMRKVIGTYKSLDDTSPGAPNLKEPQRKVMKNYVSIENLLGIAYEDDWLLYYDFKWSGDVFIKGNWED